VTVAITIQSNHLTSTFSQLVFNSSGESNRFLFSDILII
jgi:hypothetical protein